MYSYNQHVQRNTKNQLCDPELDKNKRNTQGCTGVTAFDKHPVYQNTVT